tara:strand:+ start:260 stop:490 length:231 start_codon:yes stop_codon:yes gene_type:complete
MTFKNKIEGQVLKLLFDIFKKKNILSINQKLKNIDSIEKVKLVIALETKFKIDLKSKDFDKISSIISITNMIIKKR